MNTISKILALCLLLTLVGCGESGSPGSGALPSNNWHTQSSLSIPNDLWSITYGNGQFVAVGDSGAIATSPDGTIWTSRNSGTTYTLSSITFGGGKFVAVGGAHLMSQPLDIPGPINPSTTFTTGTNITIPASVILTSPDGINWSSAASGVTDELFSVAYGSGQFVTVGDNGVVLTSPDGINWTNRGAQDTILTGITFGNGEFVAVGWLGIILTSPDGITWTSQTSGASNISFLNNIAYGNGQFVVVKDSGAVLTSPNGVSWTTQVISPTNTETLMGVTYGDGQFVAVGGNPAGGAIVTSPNGISWTRQVSGVTSGLNSITNNNGKFVAVGNSGTIIVN